MDDVPAALYFVYYLKAAGRNSISRGWERPFQFSASNQIPLGSRVGEPRLRIREDKASPTYLPPSFDGLIESPGNPRLPSRVLNRFDGQRIRRVAQHARVDSDDLSRSRRAYASRQPFGAPPVTRTVVLPSGEANEPRPAIGAELLPPRFIFRIGGNKDFRARHHDRASAMW